MLPLIDSHCHLDFADFDADRDEIIRHCKQLGLTHIMLPAVTYEHWPRLIQTCQQSDILHYALGYHPMFMDQHPDDALTKLDTAIEEFNPIAVGEIGLDFFLTGHDKKSQLTLFEGQLKLAQKHQLPTILHVRKAHDDVLKLLRKIPLIGGIIHAFSGSLQQAQQYQALGFLLGVGGALTYPRAQRLQNTFREIPLSHIALETDAPDMPFYGHQGERNSPEHIPLVAKKLAELRGETMADIAVKTSTNVRILFNL